MSETTLGVAALRTKLDLSGIQTGMAQAKGQTVEQMKQLEGQIAPASKRVGDKIGQGISSGFETAKKSAQSFTQQAMNDLKQFGSGLGGILGAGGLVFGLQTVAKEYNSARIGSELFARQLERNNQDVREGARVLEDLGRELGLVPEQIADSATQLLRQGLTMDEISTLFKGAAASALAAGKTTQQGIEAVSAAVVNQNSIYLNQAGIAENLITAYREQARALGKNVEELTKEERARAAVLLVQRATVEEVADLPNLLGGLTGAQNDLTKAWTEFRMELGENVAPVVTGTMNALAGALRVLNDLPGPVKAAGAAAAIAATGVLTLATAVGTLSLVLGPLLGPAGLIILGVSAVAALGAAFVTAASPTEQYAGKIRDAKKAIDEAKDTAQLEAAILRVRDSLQGDAKQAWIDYAAEIRAAGLEVDETKRKLEEFLNTRRLPLELKKTALEEQLAALSQLEAGTNDLSNAQENLNALREKEIELTRQGDTTGAADVRMQILQLNSAVRTGEVNNQNLEFITERREQLTRDLEEVNRELAKLMVPVNPNNDTPTPTPTPTNTPTETRAKVRSIADVIAELEDAMQDAERQGLAFGESFDVAGAKISALRGAVTELLTKFNLDPANEHVQRYIGQLRELETAERRYAAIQKALQLDSIKGDTDRTGNRVPFTPGPDLDERARQVKIREARVRNHERMVQELTNSEQSYYNYLQQQEDNRIARQADVLNQLQTLEANHLDYLTQQDIEARQKAGARRQEQEQKQAEARARNNQRVLNELMTQEQAYYTWLEQQEADRAAKHQNVLNQLLTLEGNYLEYQTQQTVEAMQRDGRRETEIALGATVRLTKAQQELGQATRNDVTEALRGQIATLEVLINKTTEGTPKWYDLIEALRAARAELEGMKGLLDGETLFGGYFTNFKQEVEQAANLRLIFNAEPLDLTQEGKETEDKIGKALERAAGNVGPSIAQSILAGDVGSAFNRIANDFGSILGQTVTQSVGGIGGSLLGGLAGGAISLIAGLIFGSQSNKQTEEMRARAESRRASSTPSINITAIVNQTNNLNGSIMDPAVREHINGMARNAAAALMEQAGVPTLIQQTRKAA